MTLGQLATRFVLDFIIEHSFGLVVLAYVFGNCLLFYNKFLHINRDTDTVDLMSRYVWLETGRKYHARKYKNF